MAGVPPFGMLPWLLLSTACLYGGGVVLNDVFDRDLDRVERPERPIPSGRVPASVAAIMGAALLVAGVVAAAQTTWLAAHDRRRHRRTGALLRRLGQALLPVAAINMGSCRALNLLLGAAAVPAAVRSEWWLGGDSAPLHRRDHDVSRGEVHGGSRRNATVALISLGAALLVLAVVAARAEARALPAVMLLLILGWRVLPPFLEARRTPMPGPIRTAVKRGVLSLVLVDAVISAAYAGPFYAAAVVLTAFLAGSLARRFAVT